MRIVNQKITVNKLLFSKVSAVVYFLIMCTFIYKSFELFPIWVNARDKSDQAKIDYAKKTALANQKQVQIENNQTDLGKERYQKDFFNKLDDGENLIILYGDKTASVTDDEVRAMFWWQTDMQNFEVWWRNLQLFKK